MSVGSVLIVCGKNDVADSMSAMLMKEGFFPVHIAHSANEARRQYRLTPPDLLIIFMPLPDEYGRDLVHDAAEKIGPGIVVVARPEQLPDLQMALENTGALILPKPINRLTLLQTARFALSVSRSLNQLKSERDNLKKRMDERRVLEKAKWILVERMKMSEPQANRWIQKQAMDLRLPLLKVAEKIVNNMGIE